MKTTIKNDPLSCHVFADECVAVHTGVSVVRAFAKYSSETGCRSQATPQNRTDVHLDFKKYTRIPAKHDETTALKESINVPSSAQIEHI